MHASLRKRQRRASTWFIKNARTRQASINRLSSLPNAFDLFRLSKFAYVSAELAGAIVVATGSSLIFAVATRRKRDERLGGTQVSLGWTTEQERAAGRAGRFLLDGICLVPTCEAH